MLFVLRLSNEPIGDVVALDDLGIASEALCDLFVCPAEIVNEPGNVLSFLEWSPGENAGNVSEPDVRLGGQVKSGNLSTPQKRHFLEAVETG